MSGIPRITVNVVSGAVQAAVGISAQTHQAVVKIHVTTNVDGLASREYVDKKVQEAAGGVAFEVDDSLSLKDGILSVNTTNAMEQDNTLPITSAGVYATVGNIEALLKTI